MEFSFIDLFCGMGGFRIAFEKQGGKCVFSSDIDKYAQETYFMNFGAVPAGDITKIDAKDIPDHDVLCAGFPCQPFSLAGKRLGFEDTRGTLFFDVARILKEKKPKAFILENVRGLANHDGGKTLDVILTTLKEIGYNFKYSILNAKDYNVPQNRDRWYCVGIRSDLNHDINNFNFPEKKKLVNKLSTIIENCSDKEYQVSNRCWENIQTFVKEKEINVSPSTLAYDIRPSRCHFVTGEVSNCLTAKMGTGGNNVAVVISQHRKLTERECLRLMGYPEEYKVNKGFQTYKQIGNSVVVPVICEIAKKLIQFISD